MHTTKVEAADGSILMTIEGGGDAAGTAEIIARHFGGKVKPVTQQRQQQPPAQNSVLVFSNEAGASAAPQPPPGAVTPLEIPSTADPDWPNNKYVLPVPYKAEIGTYHRTPLFSENATITPLESPEPTFVPENKAQPVKAQNYRPAGADGLVNNITPLEIPTMKF